MREMEPESKIIESIEILPLDVGSLKASEAAPILTRAASRIDIVKPKTEFWGGMQENLRGAAAWIEAHGSSFKGKALRAVATASLIGTMVSACGPVEIGGFVPPDVGPRATESIPTEMPLPTEAPTQEPTEIPDSISTKELLAECPVVIEGEANLVGPTNIEGRLVNLNYPDINVKVTFAIHPSMMGGLGPSRYPLSNIEFDDQHYDYWLGEGGAERQVVADILYVHYKAWQHESAEELEQRQATTFEGYLQMISEGGDGSHQLWVRTKSSSAIPSEQVSIDPLMPVVVIFSAKGSYFGGGREFSYDANNGAFVIRLTPELYKEDIADWPRELRVDQARWAGYRDLFWTLSLQLLPADKQKSGNLYNIDYDEIDRIVQTIGTNVYFAGGEYPPIAFDFPIEKR